MKLKYLIAIGLGMLTLVSIQIPAHAVSPHTANVIVTNPTGQRMVDVKILRKYSNNYKNSQTWANLPSVTGTSASPFTVSYNHRKARTLRGRC